MSRWLAVWRRNALVWRKSAKTALLGGFAEPLFYLFALGYGLGSFVGEVDGVSYIAFLTAGILSTSAMNAATFEGLYLAYTRMEVLKTWDGMLAAPLSISDVVMGEILWMGTKSLISAALILLVTAAFGLAAGWHALWVLPMAFLTGLCFGGMALARNVLCAQLRFFRVLHHPGRHADGAAGWGFFPSGRCRSRFASAAPACRCTTWWK